jgi:hypothetical protein
VREHTTRALLELADTLPPPAPMVAQAYAAEEIDQSDQLTYKLLRHSRWPILATVGRLTDCNGAGCPNVPAAARSSLAYSQVWTNESSCVSCDSPSLARALWSHSPGSS